jgi:transposase
MQVETLDAAVVNYINEIKTQYEQRIRELQQKFESSIKEVKEYQYKYLEIKEQYDLLLYKRFGRSAEQAAADDKQPLLFAEEPKQTETPEAAEPQEYTEVKSFQRRKGGRKPLDAKLTRKEIIIDLPESEKICACGAKLTRIGEETSEKLCIIPQQIFVERTVRPKYAGL